MKQKASGNFLQIPANHSDASAFYTRLFTKGGKKNKLSLQRKEPYRCLQRRASYNNTVMYLVCQFWHLCSLKDFYAKMKYLTVRDVVNNLRFTWGENNNQP